MSLSLRDSWQEAWATALSLTAEALQQADPDERAARAGAVRTEGVLGVPLLGQTYQICPPEYAVTAAGGAAVPLTEQLLVLHYLQTATGAPLAGRWIGFEQVPGGELYLGIFRARSVDRLVRYFAGREAELLHAAAPLGGVPADLGDVAVRLEALPRVPLAAILWRGDDEFPPTGNLLFDASVTQYLPVEDMVVLAGMAVGRLCGKGGGR
jgi:hypothetical protein